MKTEPCRHVYHIGEGLSRRSCAGYLLAVQKRYPVSTLTLRHSTSQYLVTETNRGRFSQLNREYAYAATCDPGYILFKYKKQMPQ
jgi:hypothetical protein